MNKTVKHLCCRFHQLILFFSEHITWECANAKKLNISIQYTIRCKGSTLK
jgi:hypothetical protein